MPTNEEAVFCKIAIKNNLLTIEQCKECIRLKKSGDKTLCEAFVEKGYLSARMADIITRLQERVCEEERSAQGQKQAFDAGKTQQIDTRILDDISSELADSSTNLKLNLTDLGETIHPDVVRDDTALPPKIIGNDTFMKNLSAEEQEEISKIGNFLPEVRKSDNVVYNVNVQNYSAGQDSEPESRNAISLRRSDLSDAQMLALIKGERINLPIPQHVIEAQMPMRYVAAGQETIMAAVQKNMLISLLSVLALLLLGGIGLAAFVFMPERDPRQIVITPPPTETTMKGQPIKERPLYDVLELLDPRKTESLRRIGCEELTRRLQNDKENARSVIEPLVMTCLRDDSMTVYREARAALEGLRDTDDEMLRQSAITQLIVAFKNENDNTRNSDPKRSPSEMKIIFMEILDRLNCREIVPEVLSAAIFDADPIVRERAMDLLEKREPAETLTLLRGFYEKFPGDPVAGRALNYFWNKCDKSRVFGELLALDNAAALCTTINYIAEFKVAEYMNRYAELVASHAAMSVKLTAIRALTKFGAAADGVVFAPFDATLKSLKDNVDYRKAVMGACQAIRGPNSDKILVYLVENDPDAGIKNAARNIVAKTGTPQGKELLADYDRRVYAAQVEAKRVEINGLLIRVNGNDRPAMPELWAVLQDKSKLVDDALMKTDLLNREGLQIMVEKKYLEWGYVKISDGTWVDPWPTWVQLSNQADAKVKAKDYLGATELMRKVDANLRKNPEINKNVDLKIEEIRKVGEVQLGVDYEQADKLIKEDKFDEARKLIDLMAQRYTKGDVFTPAWTAYVDRLDRDWKRDEKIYRAWVCRPLKAGATYAEVTKQMTIAGVTKMNEDTSVWLRADALRDYIRITHNPQKLYSINERTQQITLNTGNKKISDYSDFEIQVNVKKDWEAEVEVTINCGAGGVYKMKQELGGGGRPKFKLDPKLWLTVTKPTGENKPLEQAVSIVLDFTFRPKDRQNVKDDTYIELGEVKFLN